MTLGGLHYSVGNEHDPGDPWGRSELDIDPHGSARLSHHFSRVGSVRTWTGRVDAAAMQRLLAALDEADFPTAPDTPLAPGAAPRRLVVERDGVSQQAVIGYHQAPKMPGYAEAFDLLDAVVRQLSADTVTYPTGQPTIVHDAAETTPPVGPMPPH